MADSERVIDRCHDLMSRAHAAGRRLTPAAEWLLDNHYLIGQQVHLARKHFPRGYNRQLPRLAGGDLAGLPRVYHLILEFITHVDGRVDDEALMRYTAAYQSVAHLTLGELWSVAIMLRLALIENLRRVAVSTSWQRAHRDCALAWAQRLDAPAEKHESAVLVLADMVRQDPPLSTAFVAQFTQALQGRGATTTFVMSWLEQRLAERGQTIEEVVRAESQSQAANQASMANCIASLRLVSATEWPKFVEANSATEQILRAEPAGVYARMDFATRDEYRHVVEATARRRHLDEEVVARTAVALCATRHAAQRDDVAAHVGYVLVDDGKRQLERALRGRRAARLFPPRLRQALKLLAYLGPVAQRRGGELLRPSGPRRPDRDPVRALHAGPSPRPAARVARPAAHGQRRLERRHEPRRSPRARRERMAGVFPPRGAGAVRPPGAAAWGRGLRPARLTLDGQLQPDASLRLVNDQRDHAVEVRFGPGPVAARVEDVETAAARGS